MPSKGQIQLYVLGIEQKAIAKAHGCSKSYVSRCLSGKQKPSKRLIEIACKVTGLSAAALFEVEPK